MTSEKLKPEPRKGISREYLEFLLQEQRSKEPRTWYEKFCKFSESLKINPPQSIEEKFKFDIVFSSINASPTGVFSASILAFLLIALLLVPIAFILNDLSTAVFLLLIPIAAFWYLYTYSSFQASVTRVQAGDEAIKIILYMAIYLKLNPSLEGAVNFAVSHAKGPITEDIKKAMWDLHVGKYRTVEEALGKYTQKWVWWNEDFVRSLSLIYDVLIEPTERGREEILRKSLSFILDSTHGKMKKYVEEISSPIMLLHVMGLLLPVIGLIMFPMLAIFLHQQISTPQLILAYIFFLPLVNYFLINRILQKRPGAFMVPDISKHPQLPPEDYFEIKFGKTRFWVPIIILSILLGLIVMTYGIFHFVDLMINLASPPPDIVSRFGCPIGTSQKTCILLNEKKMSLTNILSTFSITAGFAVAIISHF